MSRIDRRGFLQQSSGMLAGLALIPESIMGGEVYVPTEPLTVGVIGCGPQGRAILAELAKFEKVRVAAVCDLDRRRLKRGARRTKDANTYEDYKEMLAKEQGMASVFLATPTYLHKGLALELLAAGKNVYCEAPMASSLEDLKTMAKAALGAKSIFQVGHQARTSPIHKLARSFYRSGAIEDLISLRAQFHRKVSWRTPTSDAAREKALNWRLYHATSSGLMGEVGSHQIDAIRYFTKMVPTSVRGSGAILTWQDGRETPDAVQLTFRYPNNVEMLYDATLGNSFEGRYELFAGTMGTIKMAEGFGWLFKEADAPIQGWEVYASRQRFHNEEGITLIADATKLASQGKLKEGIGLPHPLLYYALERFLQSVAENKPVACTADDGLHAAAVAICGNLAVRKGLEVTIGKELFKVG